jgi:hypothetical protein
MTIEVVMVSISTGTASGIIILRYCIIKHSLLLTEASGMYLWNERRFYVYKFLCVQ